jgi:hypothetical protein
MQPQVRLCTAASRITCPGLLTLQQVEQLCLWWHVYLFVPLQTACNMLTQYLDFQMGKHLYN